MFEEEKSTSLWGTTYYLEMREKEGKESARDRNTQNVTVPILGTYTHTHTPMLIRGMLMFVT